MTFSVSGASRGAWGQPPPSWRLCPHLPPAPPPPLEGGKMVESAIFGKCFGFLPPEIRILPPRFLATKNFWCRHCSVLIIGRGGCKNPQFGKYVLRRMRVKKGCDIMACILERGITLIHPYSRNKSD